SADCDLGTAAHREWHVAPGGDVRVVLRAKRTRHELLDAAFGEAAFGAGVRGVLFSFATLRFGRRRSDQAEDGRTSEKRKEEKESPAAFKFGRVTRVLHVTTRQGFAASDLPGCYDVLSYPESASDPPAGWSRATTPDTSGSSSSSAGRELRRASHRARSRRRSA